MKDVAAILIIIIALLGLAYRIDVDAQVERKHKFQDCMADIHNVYVCDCASRK
jgi:hypothetical protein